ncbi:hypothetical protein D0T66_15775, partial [Dysgonomonas sp. 25]|nr:hypothetical protein [Dysgonomonas sp. 25]
MLPRLLRRGYSCIFQEMTLVKRYLAKAIFEPTFRDLHLKVKTISKNAPRSLTPFRDDNKANSYRLMAKSYKSTIYSHHLFLLPPLVEGAGGGGLFFYNMK